MSVACLDQVLGQGLMSPNDAGLLNFLMECLLAPRRLGLSPLQSTTTESLAAKTKVGYALPYMRRLGSASTYHSGFARHPEHIVCSSKKSLLEALCEAV